MDDPARGVDEAIRKAMEDGQFNDLPGAGKPLHLEDHPYEDPEWSLAFHMLRENEFTLPWIADRQEIEADLDAACQTLLRAYRAWHANPSGEETWRNAEVAFQERVSELNKRIRDYNLSVPSPNFQRLPINSEREVQRLTAANPAPKP